MSGWKRLSTEVVFDNDYLTVRNDQVINPRGGENSYGHVQFKNKAIAIVPIDSEGNTWLVGQDRYTLSMKTWEVPMGGGAHDEDPLEAAKRELREETGLTADTWSLIMRLHLSTSLTDEEGIVFVAQDLTEGDTDFDETEEIEVRKVPLAEAIAMIARGEITDASSVAALLRITAAV